MTTTSCCCPVFKLPRSYSKDKFGDDYDTFLKRTSIFLINNTSANITVNPVLVEESLSVIHWGVETNNVETGRGNKILWIDRSTSPGTIDGRERELTILFSLGGYRIRLQHQLPLNLDEIIDKPTVQISAAGQSTGWISCQNKDSWKHLNLSFTGVDAHLYQITATQPRGVGVGGRYKVKDGDVVYTVSERMVQCILPQIEHVVVLMLENASFDTLIGWLYPEPTHPNQFIPPTSTPIFNGLNTGSYYNSHPDINEGNPIPVSCGRPTAISGMDEKSNDISRMNEKAIEILPKIDPSDEYDEVLEQIEGNMGGFLSNFVKQLTMAKQPIERAATIMSCYHPDQVPILSTLARSFAVCDEWFSSVPGQTWPNRSFALTGSSSGKVNNEILELMSDGSWNIPTIFDVLEEESLSWTVYKDSPLPSIAQAMFFEEYLFNTNNFGSIEAFKIACSQELDAPNTHKLPTFSWLERKFGGLKEFGDFKAHGESFLARVYEAIRSSPYRDRILFLVLFDQHGGTYDHVTPPMGAAPPYPYPRATDGSGFDFSRYGVRVPAVVISSYVTPGTVFRSPTSVPFDHASILSTLKDWKGLSDAFKEGLPSPRIATAPTLAHLLTETEPRAWPTLP